MPFMEMSTIHEQIDFSVSALDPKNLPVASQIIDTYRCPSYTGSEFSENRNYTRYAATYAIANYVAMGASCVGNIWIPEKADGVIYPQSRIRPADVSDGLSHTILLAETREERMMVWIDGGTSAIVASRYSPGNAPTHAGPEAPINYTPYYNTPNPYLKYGPSSEHPDGAMHLLGDGSVRFISQTTGYEIYTALATRDGGEAITDSDLD